MCGKDYVVNLASVHGNVAADIYDIFAITLYRFSFYIFIIAAFINQQCIARARAHAFIYASLLSVGTA